MKLKFYLTLLLPLMNLVINALREKDENTTGADDIVANQIEAAAKSLQEYVAS